MVLKKGFTLIELLAVIVILAIILAIAIPSITGLIGNTTKNAFEIDTKMILKAIEYKLVEDSSFDITTIDESNIENILKISNDNYQSIKITNVDDNPYILIVGKGKWANLASCGTNMDIIINDGSVCPKYLYNEGTYAENWIEGYSFGEGSVTKNSDNLYLSVVNDGDVRSYVSDNTVSFDEYNTLKVKWKVGGIYSTNSVDVSEIVEEPYIRIHLYAHDFFGSVTATAKIQISTDKMGYGEPYIASTEHWNYSPLKIYQVWLE